MEQNHLFQYHQIDWINKLKSELKDNYHKIVYKNDFEQIELDLTKLNADLNLNFKKSEQEYINGYKIPVKDFKTANKNALDLLNSGVQTLWFEIDSKENDFDILLSGIKIEFVRVIIEFLSKEKQDLSYFKKRANQNMIIDGHNNTAIINASKIKEIGGTNCIQNAHILKELDDKLCQMSKDEKYELLVVTGTSGDYIMDVSNLLSIKLLINEMINQYELSQVDLILASNISNFNKATSNHERNLIRLSNEVTASILGQANIVVNTPWIITESSIHQKEAIDMVNVVHVLMNESGFQKNENWMEGTILINNLCLNIMEKSWEFFLKIQFETKVESQRILLKNIDLNRALIKKSILCNHLNFIGINMFNDHSDIDKKNNSPLNFMERDFLKYELITNEN